MCFPNHSLIESRNGCAIFWNKKLNEKDIIKVNYFHKEVILIWNFKDFKEKILHRGDQWFSRRIVALSSYQDRVALYISTIQFFITLFSDTLSQNHCVFTYVNFSDQN